MTAKKKTRVNAKFDLRVGEDVLSMEASVPDARVHALELLPVFQKLTNQAVSHSIELTERKGLKISCKAGCGACCKQPVPVTLIEAEHLSQLVKKMPESQQRQIREKFKHIIEAVTEAGLLDRLKKITELATQERQLLAKEYFNLGLDCPFLINQSCGIYNDRPLQCREFLVTSDPRFCAELDPDRIEHVEQPLSMASALRKLSVDSQNTTDKGWILMIFALDFMKSGRLRFKKRWGKSWLESYIRYVIGK